MHIANTIDMCMLDDPTRAANSTDAGAETASTTPPHSGSRAYDDRQVLEQAEATLMPLLHHDSISSPAVEAAQEALIALRDRARAARERCERARAKQSVQEGAGLALDQHQRRVDGGIIDARVRIGDVRMIRDSLARDVARARRRVEESEREDGIDGEAGLVEGQQMEVVDEQEEIEALSGALENERRLMEHAETQLQDVVDDITRIRKKRAELCRKMKDAEREW